MNISSQDTQQIFNPHECMTSPYLTILNSNSYTVLVSLCRVLLSVSCRRAFGPTGVSIRKLSQPLEFDGHPRHV